MSSYVKGADEAVPALMQSLRVATTMVTSIADQRLVTPSDLAAVDISDIPSDALVEELQECDAHLLQIKLPEGISAIESLYHTAKDKHTVSDVTARGDKSILR